MKCPKCRSEVANQAVCPYCGATVYVSSTTWSPAGGGRLTVPIPQSGRPTRDPHGLERRLERLETKLNLLLVFQLGTFMLALLALVVLALQS